MTKKAENLNDNRAHASRNIAFGAILKEALLAALVALALAVVMLGLRVTDSSGGIGLESRWGLVLLAVIAVFVGRFCFSLYREFNYGLIKPQTDTDPTGHGATDAVKRDDGRRLVETLLKIAVVAGLAFALGMPFLPFADRYIVDIGVLVLTYVMLGWGLNIVVGLAGLLDLGYVAFYAVGAYSYALLSYYFGWSFWMCLPMAGLFAASFGVLLGFPVLRLRGDYLAIVTLGFGEIIRVILINWYQFTGGPDGISDIPRPSFFGLPFSRYAEDGTTPFHSFFGIQYSSIQRVIFLYYVILGLALLTNAFILRIRRLPMGRAWEALREDEIACRSLGINPTNTKLTAFALGAMIGGFAGAFFATRQGFISPESFTFIESAVILAIVVLGGMGSQVGVVLAAVLLIGGTELFRGLAEYRMLTFGALMVAVMVWKPKGLLSHRAPSITLGGKARARANPPSAIAPDAPPE